MSQDDQKTIIESGNAVMGMELGSTRIKAVLVGPDNQLLSTGGHGWENIQIDGVWTYSLDEVWSGIASCFADLRSDVRKKYNVELKTFVVGGFSAMMHGYLVFDKNDRLLTPFRTWRNNITADASKELTGVLNYPIPQRWSIAHLHQSILNGEAHVKDIAYITTLSGYVHWQLTGEKVIGIGDASGMFPIDIESGDFDAARAGKFDAHVSGEGHSWKLSDIFPRIIPAGEIAGRLTPEGAKKLDSSGTLEAGIPLCPPEGDAGTGMVATNSVRVRTGNVSAGTSVFAMLVMEKEPAKVHEEIDLVTTPDGKLVGMAHSNNCTSDYDAWIGLFGQAAKALGAEVSTPVLYDTLLALALKGDPDCGGLLSYGYISGEHITGFSEGRPLFVRKPDAAFTIENFIRSHLFTSLCALRTGLNVLMEEEGVQVDEIRGHGGFFKTAHVGQRIMAAATGTPVSLLESAGEGGAWGMALLASFAIREDESVSLPDFLDEVMKDGVGEAFRPVDADVAGFQAFFERYHRGLAIERAAVDTLS
ncbi:MAG: FGGY-family carbohydrate kinase [Spirochaetaceae bacterium]|nr:FGGY-family carbohydrate kinase [Spirochaetaceae bacterium]